MLKQYTTEDGATLRWCVKHQRYEPIENWSGYKNYMAGTTKKIDASCRDAVKEWRAYSKKIKDLEKGLVDSDDLERDVILISALKDIRKGPYLHGGDDEHTTTEMEVIDVEVIDDILMIDYKN